VGVCVGVAVGSMGVRVGVGVGAGVPGISQADSAAMTHSSISAKNIGLAFVANDFNEGLSKSRITSYESRITLRNVCEICTVVDPYYRLPTGGNAPQAARIAPQIERVSAIGRCVEGGLSQVRRGGL